VVAKYAAQLTKVYRVAIADGIELRYGDDLME
jgi:hypothetical protein